MTDTPTNVSLQPQNSTIVPGTISTTYPVITTTSSPQYFTAEDMERARQQEKDKLYERLTKQEAQLTEFKSTVDSLMADKSARDAELAKQQADIEAANRKAAEEKMTAEQLIAARQAEFEAQQLKLREDMDLKLATMQKEQEFLQLKAYAQRRIAEEMAAATIIPDIAEYVTGDTQEEIEASIEKAKEKTANIVKGAQGLMAPVPGGVSPTGGPSGPLDNLSGPRQLSREEIANMSMKDFAAYRRQVGLDRAGNGQGLFS